MKFKTLKLWDKRRERMAQMNRDRYAAMQTIDDAIYRLETEDPDPRALTILLDTHLYIRNPKAYRALRQRRRGATAFPQFISEWREQNNPQKRRP